MNREVLRKLLQKSQQQSNFEGLIRYTGSLHLKYPDYIELI